MPEFKWWVETNLFEPQWEERMLINTLKLLVMAGSDALRSTCGLPIISENITQIHHGHLTFPSLGELGFSKGTLQRIYLGCDATLCGHLADKIDQSSTESGLETLSNKFLKNILKDMEGRNPQGWVEHVEVGPLNLHSSGVRSFGFRFQTEVGEFYLMAEVPSRAELDLAKEGEVLAALANTYLPKGWISFQEMKFSSEIDNFLIFLRKTEIDIQVEVPAEKDTCTIQTGIMLENTTFNGERAMLVSMDVSGPEGETLKPGDFIRARVGIQDRAITFTSKYLGTGNYPIAGEVSIKCVYFALPKELKVEQRRRAFRINTAERIPVEIKCLPPEEDEVEIVGPKNAETSIRGRLADISFSGARIIADQDKLMKCVNENSHVSCRVYFPDKAEPLEIVGIIRRATVRLTDRDTQQNEVGLEFLASEGDDREALEFIRQYVLSQQRVWLSQRIHVAGVEQW